MNFTDIFKNSFLAETVTLTSENFLMSMLLAFLCAMIIYVVYKLFYRGVVYNENFNVLLVMVTLITNFVVIVISSNVVLSLGMVGALSIVRFRTAIKDPLDVGFVFWAISTGITTGAGLYIISIYATLSISIVYILLSTIKTGKGAYLLIVKHHQTKSTEVSNCLKMIKKTLKNKTTTREFVEVTYELHTSPDRLGFMNELVEIEGVESAVVLEFAGDYTG